MPVRAASVKSVNMIMPAQRMTLPRVEDGSLRSNMTGHLDCCYTRALVLVVILVVGFSVDCTHKYVQYNSGELRVQSQG